MSDCLVRIRQADGSILCIPNVQEEIRWKIPPGPDPDPDPWTKLFFDIITLEEISQGVAIIQDHQARRQLTQALQNTVEELSKQLPEGVSIGEGAFTYSS
jgi:hypothetical protein